MHTAYADSGSCASLNLGITLSELSTCRVFAGVIMILFGRACPLATNPARKTTPDCPARRRSRAPLSCRHRHRSPRSRLRQERVTG